MSLPYDQVLAADDLTGSRAHVRGLVRAGVLSLVEADAVLAALDQVGVELADGTFAFVASDEDIHTAVERRVTEIAGPAGAKLHTGRSRNDQVATDLRLFTKRELLVTAGHVLALQQVLVDRARQAGDAYLPGLHPPPAGPAGAAGPPPAGPRLGPGPRRRSPVGLPAPPRRVPARCRRPGRLVAAPGSRPGWPQDLGFAAVFDNSLDAVSDRDFVAEALFVLTLIGVHLSRLGEEIVLWSSAEFGFLGLDDEYATGSSMLPQKKNPDIAELARGQAAAGSSATWPACWPRSRGCPWPTTATSRRTRSRCSTRSTQVNLALVALGGLLATATFHTDVMAAAADGPEVAATDLAEHLVSGGMPFRDAHALVGALVRRSLTDGRRPGRAGGGRARSWDPTPWRCSARAWRCAGAPPGAVPAPGRWPTSWWPSRPGW